MPKSAHSIDFSRVTGLGVRVAVVDSGISLDHPSVGPVDGGVELGVDGDCGIICGTDYEDRSGHGTACAGIIRSHAPRVGLFSVRILDGSLRAEGAQLVAAIRWATDQGIDIVNLSLGTTDSRQRDALDEATRRAGAAGTIVVAAVRDDGVESYPSVLPHVIGVRGERVRGRYGYRYLPGALIECVARGDSQRLCWTGQRQIMAGGSSFAAAHISGIISLIREQLPGAPIEVVRAALAANAQRLPREGAKRSSAGRERTGSASKPRADEPTPAGLPDHKWIGRAALYPYTKEMHAFVRFRDMLAFEIACIGDPVGRGQAGKDAAECLGLAPLGIRVRPSLEAALEGADTLILGYLDQLSTLARKDLLLDAVSKALAHGLNVFSFLPIDRDAYAELHERAGAQGLRLVDPLSPAGKFVPSATTTVPEEPLRTPVVGVFGTSSQQGKFTLQLALRRELKRLGYSIGQVGTEHHAELFGMDVVFPMGYAPIVPLPVEEYVPFLDSKMRELSTFRDLDLIVVGGQSGVIPFDNIRQRDDALASLAFLLGTNPDACVLVVNSIDPDAYVRDTIAAIQSLVRAPTILLAVSDRERRIRYTHGRTLVDTRSMRQEEIDSLLRSLEDRFGLPAIEILSPSGQQAMAQTVVDYFTGER